MAMQSLKKKKKRKHRKGEAHSGETPEGMQRLMKGWKSPSS